MLRAFFIRLVGFILITSILAQLGAPPAQADSAEEVYALTRQAVQLYNQGKYAEASDVARQALTLAETALGPEHPVTLKRVNNLAFLHQTQGRYAEAEPLYQRALAGLETTLGPEHPDTLRSVNNLAALYQVQRRYAEAEPLYRRALAGLETALGPEHSDTLRSVNNLAGLYESQWRYAEAEPLYQRVLAGNETALGPEHPATLTSVNNLAFLYRTQSRYAEAEPLFLRALAGREAALGPEHPDTLVSVSSLAGLYELQWRYAEAEPLFLRALAGRETSLGPEHPDTLTSINDLAALSFARQDWLNAAQFWRRSTAAIAGRVQRGAEAAGLTGKKTSEAQQLDWHFWSLVKTVYRLAPEGGTPDAASASEMFRTAQWALTSEAAQSLAKMATRGAKGDAALAALMRERQDLADEWQAREKIQAAALGEETAKRNAKAEAENRERMAAIDRRIIEIDVELKDRFPEYFTRANPGPLSVEDVQAQLRADEALVLFLDTREWRLTPEETFIWVVTKTQMRWLRSNLGKEALAREVQALRCGLDEEQWATPTRQRKCADLLGLDSVPDPELPLPFDIGKAHELFQALFGQVVDVIAGKRLLIVPSGPLTSLPFHVLVTKKPASAVPTSFKGYRDVAWLGKQNAIVTLPAVSSLRALRQNAANRQAAVNDYAGYGNPVLQGEGAECRLPEVPKACPALEVAQGKGAPSAAEQTAAIASPVRAIMRGGHGRRSVNASTDAVFDKGATSEAVLKQVRALCPLPDTAYEIQCVAERYKEKAPLIRLDAEAREPELKAMNESGELASYRILHFATHGLLSGDVERMAKRQGEPALVLTPPDKPVDADDDGLLMASEVAALKLNADWIVLSACNTAAGDDIGAEALSGLARAFFYAGGRTLLVSHWPVYSDAAVRLTTRAFIELDSNPKAGRAEALQQAMIALMDDPSQLDNAHPAVWAPFVVVGEGAR